MLTRFIAATAVSVGSIIAVGAVTQPASAAHDPVFEFLGDLNTEPGDPDIGDLVDSPDFVFFAADDGIHGQELWAYDKATEAIKLIRDIDVGADSSQPRNLFWTGNELLFSASDGSSIRLWRSDGTEGGTTKIDDVVNPSLTPGRSAYVDGRYYFAGTTGATGIELWSTDGSNPATLIDVNPGTASSNPQAFAVDPFGNQLYFVATSAAAGSEIRRYDGSLATIDLTPGAASSSISELRAAHEALYAAVNGSTRDLLVFPDSSEDPVDMIANATILPVSLAFGMLTAPYDGSKEALVLSGQLSGETTRKLISVNSNGVAPVAVTSFRARNIAVVGERVMFDGDDPTVGREPHVLDPSTGTVTLLGDLVAGAGGSEPRSFVPSTDGSRAMFWAALAPGQIDLHLVDGTTVTPAAVAPTFGEFRMPLVGVDADVWAVATDDPSSGRTLFLTDGSKGGTTELGNPNEFTGSFDPNEVTAVGSIAVLSATADGGREPWRIDTDAGTGARLADLEPGDGGSDPRGFVRFGDHVYFGATVAGDGGWFRTDGSTVTEVGTQGGAPVNVGVVFESVAADGQMFVREGDSSVQRLLRSDGTAPGTRLLPVNGTADADVGDVVALGSGAVFVARSDALGREVWFTDGTDAGTIAVTSTVSDVNPRQLAPAGDVVYFLVDDGGDTKLRRTDGTVVGTTDVALPGQPTALAGHAGRLYVSGEVGGTARLWVIEDGVVSEITLPASVLDVDVQARSAATDEVFAARASTASGDVVIVAFDEEPAVVVPGASDPSSFRSHRRDVYFSAATAAAGSELWRADGTAGTTELLSDFAPGASSSFPVVWFIGDTALASGETGTLGVEMFLADVTPHAPSAPSGVAATAGDRSLTASWAAPADDGGADVNRYVATAQPGGATCQTTGATTCTIVGLTNGAPYTVRVTAANEIGTSPSSAASAAVTPTAPPEPPTPTAPAITPIDPARYWDSRNSPTFDAEFTNTGRLADESIERISIAGRGQVPADATGIVANLTVIAPDGPGFGVIYPCSDELPVASNVNYVPGDVLANNTVVPLDADGDVCVYTFAAADYALDVNGFIDADSPLVGIEPARYLETRATGPTFDGRQRAVGRTGDEGVVEVEIAGRGEVPADARAVVVNATVIAPDRGAFATLYPCGERPNASNINYAAGAVTPNGAIVELSADGTLCVYTHTAADLIVDVGGYVPAGADSISATTPMRFLETRPGFTTIDGEFMGSGPLGAGEEIEIPIAGRNGVPTTATAAIVNVAAIGPLGAGFLTLHPCGERPFTSNLNYASGTILANNAVTRLSASGTLCIYTLAETDIILDVSGWLTE